MQMIMMMNRKGGVAKTTNAVAIARCFAAGQKRVLLIDSDHQCTASELLLGPTTYHACDSNRHTLHDLLAQMLDPEFDADTTSRYLAPVPVGKNGVLHVLPCSARIEEFQTNRAKAQGGFKTNDEFRRAWAKNARAFQRHLTNRFDYVIVDCPPSLALQVRFFLSISNSYILPCVPEHLSVTASAHLIERLKDLGVTRIAPLGLLWSKVKGIADHKNVIHDVARKVPPYENLPRPFAATIPDSIEVQRSTDQIDPATSFKGIYKTTAGKQYVSLCNEIIKRSAMQKA